MGFVIGLIIGTCFGAVIVGLFASAGRADATTTASADRERANSLERANGVLRRELAELRITEAPRDHGYGVPHG